MRDYDKRHLWELTVAFGGLLAVLLAASGCGSDGDTGVRAQEGASEEDSERAELPLLPPLRELDPDLYRRVYNEEGCTIMAPGEVDCSAKDTSGEPPASPESYFSYRGFIGSGYTEDVSEASVVVLGSSITTGTTPGGKWSATGLISNQSMGTGRVTVTASLKDPAGDELATVSAPAAVAPVRPGEPAPFTLHGDIPPNAEVASVSYTAELSDDFTGLAARDTLITLAGAHNPGASGGAARRSEFLGSVRALGADSVEDPRVVLAVLDTEGRVTAVLVDPLYQLSDGRPAKSLGRRASSVTPSTLFDFKLSSTSIDFLERWDQRPESILLWTTMQQDLSTTSTRSNASPTSTTSAT